MIHTKYLIRVMHREKYILLDNIKHDHNHLAYDTQI